MYGSSIYKILFLMLDLVHPLFGSPYLLNKPRNLICEYVLASVFISCFYNAGMSTKLIFINGSGLL